MKLPPIKRWNKWKLKQKKFNQKYKLRSFKKIPSRRDKSKKYRFLISSKNFCTVLKFNSNNSCTTEAALIVDDYFRKQMSKKVFIRPKHKKFMSECEVMVTQKYKNEVMKIFNMVNSSQPKKKKKALKKVTPIKILSCTICDQKFMNLTTLNQHYQTIHKLESENETDSDGMTEMELDEILQDPNCVPIQPKIVINKYDMSLNSTEIDCDTSRVSNESTSPTNLPNKTPNTLKYIKEEDKSEFRCRMCKYPVTSRGMLNRHLLGLHILNVFKCYICKVDYVSKLKLKHHLKIAHQQYKEEENYLATLCDPEAFSFYHCCFCKYSSVQRENVVEHLLAEHYDEFDMDTDQESRNTSTPDSLDELLLPENRAKLLGFKESLEVVPPRKRVKYPFRCVRCKRKFSTKYWLKDHVCAERKPSELEPPAKVQRNLVNGFYHCPHPKCSQVYTNRVLYDVHLAMDHPK